MTDYNEALRLKSGTQWYTKNINYNFLTLLPSYYSSSAEERKGFTSPIVELQLAVKNVFDLISTFTNLKFYETTNQSISHISIGMAALPLDEGAHAYYPTQGFRGMQQNTAAGDAWFNTTFINSSNLSAGQYGHFTVLHEIGHSLGLKHTHDVGISPAYDNEAYSVMSYNWSTWGQQYAKSYMIYDIAALQSIYGANMAYKSGDDTYIFNNLSYTTIWDAGGNDTISHYGLDAVVIDLNPGEWSGITGSNLYSTNSKAFTLAYNVNIENASGGSSHDIIRGNSLNNNLYGNEGNDLLYGNEGNDLLYGGNGNDLLDGQNGSDTLYGDAGDDIIYASRGDAVYGGTGADHIIAYSASGESLNNSSALFLRDFNKAEGDKLDLSSVLETYDPLTQSISNFITYSPKMPFFSNGPVLSVVDSNSSMVVFFNNTISFNLKDWIADGTIIV